MRIAVAPNGDLVFRCESCKQHEKLPKTAQASPFWEMFVGNMALVMIQHEIDYHGGGPRPATSLTQPIEFGKGPRHERPK